MRITRTLPALAAIMTLALVPVTADAAQKTKRCGVIEEPSPYTYYAKGASCATARKVLPKAVATLQTSDDSEIVKYRGKRWYCETTETYLRICSRGAVRIWTKG